jgi:hypothetical protein
VSRAGIAAATSQYVLLIHDGILLVHGSLYSLWQSLRSNLSASMVVPLVLENFGQVSSAGGIIWKDGSTAMFGAGASYTNAQVNVCSQSN